jgi:predicted RNase H-like nuclease (RuvC/YqgF family)
MSKEKTILKQITTLLGMETKLEEMTLPDGMILVADEFAPNQPCQVRTSEGDIPIPKGRYQMEDGRFIVVEEDGLIQAIESAPEEPPAEEAMEEKPATQTEEKAAKKQIETVTKELHFSKEDVEALIDAKIEALKAELSEQSKETELAKEEHETEKEEDIIHKPAEKAELTKLELTSEMTTRDRVKAFLKTI